MSVLPPPSPELCRLCREPVVVFTPNIARAHWTTDAPQFYGQFIHTAVRIDSPFYWGCGLTR